MSAILKFSLIMNLVGNWEPKIIVTQKTMGKEF